jgi:hypothetical protein
LSISGHASDPTTRAHEEAIENSAAGELAKLDDAPFMRTRHRLATGRPFAAISTKKPVIL